MVNSTRLFFKNQKLNVNSEHIVKLNYSERLKIVWNSWMNELWNGKQF